MKKFCDSLREHLKKCHCFCEEKNVTVNKRRINITLIPRSMLYLRRKNLRKGC